MSELQQIIRSRRTHKLYTGEAVSVEKIREWLETAKFAPNHRRNEPWRLQLVQHRDLQRFFSSLQETLGEVIPDESTREQKKAKMQKLFETSGALLFVGSLKDERAVVEKENYAAVSCLLQNLMLLAESEKVGTFWSTNKVFCSQLFAKKHLDWAPDEVDTAAALFFGHPNGDPALPKYTLEDKFQIWEPK